MDKHSPTPWRVIKAFEDEPARIIDADDDEVAVELIDADAALIVEAVNANGAWREERRRLQLGAASAEAAFINADARRTLLERYYCEVYADRDRLRDLVRRMANALDTFTLEDHEIDLIREAREAIKEGES